MRFSFLIFAVILAIAFAKEHTKEDVKLKNSQKFPFGKCIVDKDCRNHEFCDHQWPNPIGTCTEGTKNGGTCAMDRYCSSKQCHIFKCVARKPVLDGPCQSHDECVAEQYCKNKLKCHNRTCKGWCKHSFECMSNKCNFFRCDKSAHCNAEKSN